METQFLLNFLNAIFHCCEHRKLNSHHLHGAWDVAEKKRWISQNLKTTKQTIARKPWNGSESCFFFVIWVTLESTGSREHSWAKWASLYVVLATTETLWAAYLGTFMTLSSQEDLAAWIGWRFRPANRKAQLDRNHIILFLLRLVMRLLPF